MNIEALLAASNADDARRKARPIYVHGLRGVHAELPEVQPRDLVADEMYATAEIIQDDDGNQNLVTDMVHCFMGVVFIDGTDHPIGGGKGTQFKLVRFIKTGKGKRLSDVPGTHFYGPIQISVEDV